MMVASTVAELGAPDTDGALGIIRVGTGSNKHDELLVWNKNQQAWIGRPKSAVKQSEPFGMQAFTTLGAWGYPSVTEGLAEVDNGFGFQLLPISFAKELCAAGLKLQEHLSLFSKMTDFPATIAINWWDEQIGDNFLSPPPVNFGVQILVPADAGRFRFSSTGWQNSPASVAIRSAYYPEVYVRDYSLRFRNLTSKIRWVGGSLGSTGGADAVSPQPPFFADCFSWSCADFIPVADGQPVSVWPDYSGYEKALEQSTVGKQPILNRNQLNGHAIVSFDGINDILKVVAAKWPGLIGVAPPWTNFIVLRQKASGGTQQVWYEGAGAAPPLLYRSDATDAVSYWNNAGGDVTYHRGTAWPSPFAIYSVLSNGAASNIWENASLKATGNAGSVAVGGLTIGNSFDEALPANIDVAEIISYARALSDAERNQVINYLNTKYAIF